MYLYCIISGLSWFLASQTLGIALVDSRTELGAAIKGFTLLALSSNIPSSEAKVLSSEVKSSQLRGQSSQL